MAYHFADTAHLGGLINSKSPFTLQTQTKPRRSRITIAFARRNNGTKALRDSRNPCAEFVHLLRFCFDWCQTACAGTSSLPARWACNGLGRNRKKKMSDTIPLVRAGCGATVMRRPAMRLRRVVCLDCVETAKSEPQTSSMGKKKAGRTKGCPSDSPVGTRSDSHHIAHCNKKIPRRTEGLDHER